MMKAKAWLWTLLVAVAMAGTVQLVSPGSFATADEKERELHSHWRHHDGHWSYYHEGDKRWYYTDGTNWFYNDGDAWKVYRFDKQFGREGFERGEYKAPAAGVEITTPRHHVFVR
jgi:hypothetical protein